MLPRPPRAVPWIGDARSSPGPPDRRAAGGLEPAPARRRRARRGAAAHPRGRRLGQDARAHPPHRVPDAHQAGASGRDPRDHVHQQGGAGDARARRAPGRPRHARDVGDDVPLRLRPHAPRRRPPARLHAPVHDLRRGRPAPPDQALPRRPRHRRQALHPARDAGPDLRREEQAALQRGLPPARRLLLRADGRRRLRAVRARAPPHERDGLRRPARPLGQPPRALPGGPRPLLPGLPLDPRRRVPGHQPRPVPLAPAPGVRAPQPRGCRRRRSVPRRGHPDHDGRWLGQADRGRAGGRRGPLVLRQRQTSGPRG